MRRRRVSRELQETRGVVRGKNRLGSATASVKHRTQSDATAYPKRVQNEPRATPEGYSNRLSVRLLRSLVAGGIAVGVASSIPAAEAKPLLPSLAVHRTDDCVDCPDAAALARLIDEQLKRSAVRPAVDGSVALDVQIYRSLEGYTAVVHAGGKTRQIIDKGSTCVGLSAALAVSLAVLLDTEPLPLEVMDPEPRPDPAPAPQVGDPIGSGPVAESPAPSLRPLAGPGAPDTSTSPVARKTTGSSPFEAPHARPFRGVLGAGPALTAGLLRPGAAGITADFELRFGRFSLGAGMLALPSQTVVFSPGQTTLSLTLAFLRGCVGLAGNGDAVRLALCVEPFGGALHAAGSGYNPNRSVTEPWIAAGVSTLFQQRIAGPLAWGLRAQFLVPLHNVSLHVDNHPALFSPAPVGGTVNAEVRLSIW